MADDSKQVYSWPAFILEECFHEIDICQVYIKISLVLSAVRKMYDALFLNNQILTFFKTNLKTQFSFVLTVSVKGAIELNFH